MYDAPKLSGEIPCLCRSLKICWRSKHSNLTRKLKVGKYPLKQWSVVTTLSYCNLLICLYTRLLLLCCLLFTWLPQITKCYVSSCGMITSPVTGEVIDTEWLTAMKLDCPVQSQSSVLHTCIQHLVMQPIPCTSCSLVTTPLESSYILLVLWSRGYQRQCT